MSCFIISGDLETTSLLGKNNQLKWVLEIIITNDLIKGHKELDEDTDE